MKKSIDFFNMELRQVPPLGDFFVCHCQYLERNGLWRTLETRTFYRFEFADRYSNDFLLRHNKFYRVEIIHYTSPAIVAGYYALLNDRPNNKEFFHVRH